MKYISLCGTFILLTGCASLPDLFKTVDDIATDDAITVKVDRDAIQKDTDVQINVTVKNKDDQKGA